MCRSISPQHKFRTMPLLCTFSLPIMYPRCMMYRNVSFGPPSGAPRLDAPSVCFLAVFSRIADCCACRIAACVARLRVGLCGARPSQRGARCSLSTAPISNGTEFGSAWVRDQPQHRQFDPGRFEPGTSYHAGGTARFRNRFSSIRCFAVCFSRGAAYFGNAVFWPGHPTF